MALKLPPGVNPALIPVGIPPPGQETNFVDPYSLQWVVVGCATLCMVLGVSVVFISLLEHSRTLRLADYFSVAGLIFAVPYAGIAIAESYTARHIWDVPLSFLNERWFKMTYAQPFLFSPGMFFSKTAIFLFYLHIFKVDRPMRIAIYAGIAFTFVICLPNIIITAALCTPKNGASWFATFAQPQCDNDLRLWSLIQSVLATAEDIYIFLLPLPMLARLRLARKKKIGILAVFGTAALGIAASCFSLAFKVELWTSGDESYAGAEAFICTLAENFTALIVANMVPAAAFFRKWFSFPARSGNATWRARLSYAMGLSRPMVSPHDSARSPISPLHSPEMAAKYNRRFRGSLTGLWVDGDNHQMYSTTMVDSKEDLGEEIRIRGKMDIDEIETDLESGQMRRTTIREEIEAKPEEGQRRRTKDSEEIQASLQQGQRRRTRESEDIEAGLQESQIPRPREMEETYVVLDEVVRFPFRSRR